MSTQAVAYRKVNSLEASIDKCWCLPCHGQCFLVLNNVVSNGPKRRSTDHVLVLTFGYPPTLIWMSTLPEKLARRKYSLCVNKAMLRPCGLG